MTYPNGGYQQPDYGQQNYGQPANPFAQPQGGNQPVPYQGQPQQFAQGGYPQQQGFAPASEQKSWVAALLLCFFLGGFGAHNFYTGRTGRAVAQLALMIIGMFTAVLIFGFFLIGALEIWVLVEFVMLLVGAGGLDRDVRGVPLKK